MVWKESGKPFGEKPPSVDPIEIQTTMSSSASMFKSDALDHLAIIKISGMKQHCRLKDVDRIVCCSNSLLQSSSSNQQGYDEQMGSFVTTNVGNYAARTAWYTYLHVLVLMGFLSLSLNGAAGAIRTILYSQFVLSDNNIEHHAFVKFQSGILVPKTSTSSNMSKAHPPELKKFMDKKLSLKLNGGRHVVGILRGFDPFMNLVVDETIENCKDGTQNNVGMVVIRGNSIIMLEALDREVVLHISHSSLMSSDRMKPRSRDLVVTIDFLQEAANTSLFNDNNAEDFFSSVVTVVLESWKGVGMKKEVRNQIASALERSWAGFGILSGAGGTFTAVGLASSMGGLNGTVGFMCGLWVISGRAIAVFPEPLECVIITVSYYTFGLYVSTNYVNELGIEKVEFRGSEPAFAWRARNHLGKTTPSSEIRTSIFPSFAVEYNKTSALATPLKRGKRPYITGFLPSSGNNNDRSSKLSQRSVSMPEKKVRLSSLSRSCGSPVFLSPSHRDGQLTSLDVTSQDGIRPPARARIHLSICSCAFGSFCLFGVKCSSEYLSENTRRTEPNEPNAIEQLSVFWDCSREVSYSPVDTFLTRSTENCYDIDQLPTHALDYATTEAGRILVECALTRNLPIDKHGQNSDRIVREKT
uniref:Sm protein G n=1 Tax=Timema bartmani TaxID=61472 RepID=A0A7R9HVG8_9NEOP|nr:unnamed protein product [Timema bartmani]